MDKNLAKIIGESIFYASIQSSIGSVELSSKFSVLNFAKDQTTLQNAADALVGYIYIASLWTFATMMSLYAIHGICGALIGLAANAVMMAWIILSYQYSFRQAAKKYNLKVPTLDLF